MADGDVERVRHIPANMQGAMSGGGGGYRLAPEDLKEIIAELADILDWIQTEPRQHARQLTSFLPMGDEVASITYVRNLNAAGVAYNNFLNSVVAEIKRQRDAFQQALDTYQKQEHRATDHVKGVTDHVKGVTDHVKGVTDHVKGVTDHHA